MRTSTQREAANELHKIGAGIVLPPNAVRTMDSYGLVDAVEAAGAVKLDSANALGYETGRVIVSRPGREWAVREFGYCFYVIHRADYQRLLAEEAVRLGADIRYDCGVEFVDAQSFTPNLVLSTGEKLQADLLIGADGILSEMRTYVLDYEKKPSPTGDIAYRATIPRARLEALNNPLLENIVSKRSMCLWWGPHSNATLYPVCNGDVFNLVLLVPDDLPGHINKCAADLEQMRTLFDVWDPALQAIVAVAENVGRWRVSSIESELETWVKGDVALLGDACHPTGPYQAQGAAMAVEDGAVLGRLLGLRQKFVVPPPVSQVLRLYEELRKKRTSFQAKGAVQNQVLYHMADLEECKTRDEVLKSVDWETEQKGFPWMWADMVHQREMNGFDAVRSAEEEFALRFK